MSQDFYVRQAGQISGPYSTSEIQRMARDGDITQATDLGLTDRGNWFKAAKVQGLVLRGQEFPAPEAKGQEAATPLLERLGLGSTPSESRMPINKAYPPPPPLPAAVPGRTDSTKVTESNTPSTSGDPSSPLNVGDLYQESPSEQGTEGPRLWYMQVNAGEILGPYTRQELKEWYAVRRITAESKIFRKDWTNWRRAGELFEPPAPTSMPASTEWRRSLKQLGSTVLILLIIFGAARKQKAGWDYDKAGNVIEKPGVINKALRWIGEKPLPRRNLDPPR